MIRAALLFVGVAAIGLGIIASSATAIPHYERPPTVREGFAERDALKLMHNRREWRRAYFHELDCRHGRINRFLWSCKVEWIPRGVFHCWKGRVLIEGVYFRNGYPWYRSHLKARDACSD